MNWIEDCNLQVLDQISDVPKSHSMHLALIRHMIVFLFLLLHKCLFFYFFIFEQTHWLETHWAIQVGKMKLHAATESLKHKCSGLSAVWHACLIRLCAGIRGLGFAWSVVTVVSDSNHQLCTSTRYCWPFIWFFLISGCFIERKSKQSTKKLWLELFISCQCPAYVHGWLLFDL